MKTEKLHKMIREYLDNGYFDCSGYAMIEKVGLEAMLQTDYDESVIEAHVDGPDDFDGLSDWAFEEGLQNLSNSEGFVLQTLDYSDSEMKLRYGEMSAAEQALFRSKYARLYEEVPAWLT